MPASGKYRNRMVFSNFLEYEKSIEIFARFQNFQKIFRNFWMFSDIFRRDFKKKPNFIWVKPLGSVQIKVVSRKNFRPK